MLQERLQTEKKDEYSSDGGQMPFTDDSSEDENYLACPLAKQKWKLREILRVKGLRDERIKIDEELAEIERRRGLTDEQRQAENERLGTYKKKQQVAYNFMQKFYHKGAFYQEDQDPERDVNLPTMEDKADKSVLPAIL